MLLENGREIRFVGTDCVEEYLDIYLNAYPAYKALDDECRDYYRTKTISDMTLDTDVKFTGLYENGKMIALMKIVEFQMNLFGEMRPAAGLMSLAVHPLHKKKGAALDMVKYFEKYAGESGASVALLLPFNMAFYRKMGYGYGSKLEEYHIATVNLPKAFDLSKLRLLDMSDLPQVVACQRDFAGRNHGALVKFSEEVRLMGKDTATRRIGYEEEGRLRGYIAYRCVSNHDVNYTLTRIDVDEMIYENAEVLKALLGFLRNQADLAQEVVIRTGEPDFYHLLENAADVSGNYYDFGYIQSNTAAVGTMHKIISPEKFIAETAHREFEPEELTLAFDYEDELNHCTESLLIDFSRDESEEFSTWSVVQETEGTEADVTISCKKGDLSSLLLGSLGLASMVRLGMAKISHPAYTAKLDRLLHAEQKPFSNSDY